MFCVHIVFTMFVIPCYFHYCPCNEATRHQAYVLQVAVWYILMLVSLHILLVAVITGHA